MGADQYGYDDGWSNDPNDEVLKPIQRIISPHVKSSGPADGHPLLAPLAQTQGILSRLEALASVASPDVIEGLRARLAFREASGWLAYTHVWVHHNDLALRSSHATGSYSAAALKGDFRAVIPNTLGDGLDFETIPQDNFVDLALRLAQLWRRLAEYRTWSPLSDSSQLQETMEKLGGRDEVAACDIADWLDSIRRRAEAPALLRAAAAARSWGNLPGGNPDLTADGMFLAAAVWKAKGFGRSIPLPFWSAPTAHHHKLSVRTGLDWTASYLDCVARAGRVGLEELERLKAIEAKAKEIGGTARSKLPAAVSFAIRMPAITAKSLGNGLKITPQAASVLVNQLVDMGILLEATRRESWRAFVVK